MTTLCSNFMALQNFYGVISELQIRGAIGDNSKIMSCFSTKTYVVTPHKNRLNETVLMTGHNICFYGEIWLIIPKLSLLPLLNWSTGY